jgi:hypothetical protein
MISHHQNSFVILACLLLAFEQLCASINLMEDVILYFQRAIISITEDLILGQDRGGYSLLNLLVVTSPWLNVLCCQQNYYFFNKSNCIIKRRKLYRVRGGGYTSRSIKACYPGIYDKKITRKRNKSKKKNWKKG